MDSLSVMARKQDCLAKKMASKAANQIAKHNAKP
jgi:hypothetical protein